MDDPPGPSRRRLGYRRLDETRAVRSITALGASLALAVSVAACSYLAASGGGEPNPSPVVAAIPPTLATTPTPSPTIPPGGSWQVVTPTGARGMSGVVAGGPGWIGVGGGAWTSPDGRTWTPATVEGSEPGMSEVAAGAGGYVAIGESVPRDAQGSGLIWQSADGLDWRIVGSGPQFDLGPCIEGCPSMTDVAGGPAGFVAIGYRTGGAQVAWSSSDGQRWETVPVKTFDVAESDVHLSGVAAGPSGFVIAGAIRAAGGTTERPAFWVSPDGHAWTRTGPDQASTPSAAPFAVVAGGQGFVAVGGCRDGTCAIAWTSPDGLTWTQHLIDASESPSYAEAVASDGNRVIAFSEAGTAVWTSDDGLEWTRHKVDAAPIDFEAAAGGERGFIAMGSDKAETGYYVWLSP